MSKPSIHRILLAFCLWAAPLWGLASDFGKEIHKAIEVDGNVNVRLDLSFSNLFVKTWQQPRVEVTIKIEIRAGSESRAKELMDKVEAKIAEGRTEVGIYTALGKSSCKSNEGFDITVTVLMPVTGSIGGKIQFGNADIGSLSGPCNLQVEYGNLKAAELRSASNNSRTEFGNMKIVSCGGGKLSTSYGNITLDRHTGSTSLNCEFGNIELKMGAAPCAHTEVKCDYGNARIYIPADASVAFDLNAAYGKVRLPDKVKMSKSFSDFTSEHFTGVVGKGDCRLLVNAGFGNVELIQK